MGIISYIAINIYILYSLLIGNNANIFLMIKPATLLMMGRSESMTVPKEMEELMELLGNPRVEIRSGACKLCLSLTATEVG